MENRNVMNVFAERLKNNGNNNESFNNEMNWKQTMIVNEEVYDKNNNDFMKYAKQMNFKFNKNHKKKSLNKKEEENEEESILNEFNGMNIDMIEFKMKKLIKDRTIEINIINERYNERLKKCEKAICLLKKHRKTHSNHLIESTKINDNNLIILQQECIKLEQEKKKKINQFQQKQEILEVKNENNQKKKIPFNLIPNLSEFLKLKQQDEILKKKKSNNLNNSNFNNKSNINKMKNNDESYLKEYLSDQKKMMKIKEERNLQKNNNNPQQTANICNITNVYKQQNINEDYKILNKSDNFMMHLSVKDIENYPPAPNKNIYNGQKSKKNELFENKIKPREFGQFIKEIHANKDSRNNSQNKNSSNHSPMYFNKSFNKNSRQIYK